jgi:nitrite reductase (NADH) large subunit
VQYSFQVHLKRSPVDGPSLNDERLFEQVKGNIGGSGREAWFQHRKGTGKGAWNREVSGVFFLP